MNLTCAILHPDEKIIRTLEEYIGKVPFLTLHGAFHNPLEALKEYYETKVEVYFVGITETGKDAIGGKEFCRMLSLPTRVIFVADTDKYAAECFRLDALDYLAGPLDFSVFFQSVSKATRWFSLLQPAAPHGKDEAAQHSPQEIYVRANNRIIRLIMKDIDYIEAVGDYVKIYTSAEEKPILSLCSMKCMEERLVYGEFIRIHRSYIVRKNSIHAIGRNTVAVGKKELPIGNAYREQVKRYITQLSML